MAKCFFVVISPKLAKIIGVCQVNFFSKVDFNRFFTKNAEIKVHTKFTTSESVQNTFL